MKGKKAYRLSAFHNKKKGKCLDCLHFFLYRKRVFFIVQFFLCFQSIDKLLNFSTLVIKNINNYTIISYVAKSNVLLYRYLFYKQLSTVFWSGLDLF